MAAVARSRFVQLCCPVSSTRLRAKCLQLTRSTKCIRRSCGICAACVLALAVRSFRPCAQSHAVRLELRTGMLFRRYGSACRCSSHTCIFYSCVGYRLRTPADRYVRSQDESGPTCRCTYHPTTLVPPLETTHKEPYIKRMCVASPFEIPHLAKRLTLFVGELDCSIGAVGLCYGSATHSSKSNRRHTGWLWQTSRFVEAHLCKGSHRNCP